MSNFSVQSSLEVSALLFRYFTDPQVLDRIPLMFLLLGGVSLVMEIVAMSILREPTEAEIMEIKVSFKRVRGRP